MHEYDALVVFGHTQATLGIACEKGTSGQMHHISHLQPTPCHSILSMLCGKLVLY